MPANPKSPFQRESRKPETQAPSVRGQAAPQAPTLELAYDDPGGRAQYFRRSRVGPDKRVLRGVIARASTMKRSAERKLRATRTVPSMPTPPGGAGSVNWASLGPTKVDGGQAGAVRVVVSGRVTSIAVGPGGTRAYVGTANGGAWVTEDGGSTWKALDEFFNTPAGGGGAISSTLETDSLAVGALAVTFGAARANDVVFVGTGEPGAGVDGYFGVGIKMSTDGGATFTLEATNLASQEIYRIVIDPDDPTIVFASTTGGLYQRPKTAPFTSWTQITSTFANANGPASDVAVAGKNPAKTYYAGFDGDKVYQSTDSGANWTAVPGFAGTGRIILSVGENDPSVVYALVSDGTLNRMDSGTGGSFQTVTGVPRALFAGNQGSYDAVVAADPANANTVYLVGDLTQDASDWALSIYKGTITGSPGSYVFPFNPANDQTNPADSTTTNNVPKDRTWIGRGIHPDGHALAFATKADGTHDGSIVWVGSDGGIFASTSSGTLSSFSAKNTGINLTQMTYIAQRPDTADILYGGCQDNGTIRFALASPQSWLEVVEGDGGGVAINPNNPQQVIRQYIRAILSVSGDDGKTFTDSGLPATATNENLRTGFYGPLKALAVGAKTVVAFGTNRLWFRPDWASAWQSLPSNSSSDVLDDPNPTANNNAGTVPVTAIAIASDTRVYAATSQSAPVAGGPANVYHFEFAAGAWTKTALPALPNTTPAIRFFTALSVENAASGTLYVTLGSGGGEHVFYFDGTNWNSASFSSTSVDVPTHAVAVDPDSPSDVYVGTDVGVWKGTRSGTTWTWTPFSQGLPEAAVTDLSVHSGSASCGPQPMAAAFGKLPFKLPPAPVRQQQVRRRIPAAAAPAVRPIPAAVEVPAVRRERVPHPIPAAEAALAVRLTPAAVGAPAVPRTQARRPTPAVTGAPVVPRIPARPPTPAAVRTRAVRQTPARPPTPAAVAPTQAVRRIRVRPLTPAAVPIQARPIRPAHRQEPTALPTRARSRVRRRGDIRVCVRELAPNNFGGVPPRIPAAKRR